MKVTISVGGRFHAFYLAKYLQDHDLLEELVTSYPRFETVKYGIKRKKTRSIISKEIVQRVFKFLFKKQPNEIFTANLFDFIASYRINKKSDVYIIWSSYAKFTIRRIRKKNKKAIIILERSSSHIATQQELLKNLSNPIIINKKIIEKELLEYSLTDYIMVIGKFAEKSFLVRGIPNDKLLLNYLGVDLKEFPFIERNFFESTFTIGYAGSISSRKNIEGLIKACELLYNKELKVRLILVGEIDHESFDENLLKEKPFILYFPSMPQSKLKNIYKQMHLFILNSVEDGFGMVILQAMATGLPVIATENTGGIDIIENGKNGFVIPILDNEILSEKIKYIYENRDECRSMGNNARNSIKNRFSWEDYGFRYIEMLKQLKK